MRHMLWFAAVMLTCMHSSVADTWYPTYEGNVTNGENIKINWDSLQSHTFAQTQTPYITAEIKRLYSSDRRTQAGTVYRIEKTSWYADCLNQRYQLGQISWHDKNDKQIRFAKQPVPVSSSEMWRDAASDEVVFPIYDWICWAHDVKSTAPEPPADKAKAKTESPPKKPSKS